VQCNRVPYGNGDHLLTGLQGSKMSNCWLCGVLLCEQESLFVISVFSSMTRVVKSILINSVLWLGPHSLCSADATVAAIVAAMAALLVLVHCVSY